MGFVMSGKTVGAFIAAGAVVLAVAAVGYLAGSAGDSDALVPVAVPTTSFASPQTPPSSTARARIVNPMDGSLISGSGGALLTGTSAPGDLLWLFDLDEEDGYFRASDEPLSVRNGTWEFADKPIGAASDPTGTTYSVVLVKADGPCSQKLRTAKPDEDGDIKLTTLPKGCAEVDRVSLIKVRD